MDVVEDLDHRGAGGQHQGAEERDAVLAVHHRVDAAAVAQQLGEDGRIHSERAAAAVDLDAADGGRPGLAGRAGGEQAHSGAGRGEALGHRLAVEFSTTGLRVVKITPVEEHHTTAGERVDPPAQTACGRCGHGHWRTPFSGRLSSTF